MKNIIFLYLMFTGSLVSAQNVLLNKVVKVNNNEEKIFYKIDPVDNNAEYLGEVEVQGFSDDDTKVFNMIYKKAKEIGANAFAFQPFETIDGTMSKFDPVHYKLSLYFASKEDFDKEDNMAYFISSPYNKQTISINKDKITFQPRSYTKIKMEPGTLYNVSTRQLLGSTIKIAAQTDQPVQYFQISGFAVNANEKGSAGINLKSGDIMKLEQSYAQFLTTIYQYFK